MQFLMSFDFDVVIKMYIKAKEENAVDRLWTQWLQDYRRMNDGQPINFMSFPDYKNKVFKPKNENNSKLDIKKIIEEAEAIKKADQESQSKQKGGN